MPPFNQYNHKIAHIPPGGKEGYLFSLEIQQMHTTASRAPTLKTF
jgi:hypothetical protein